MGDPFPGVSEGSPSQTTRLSGAGTNAVPEGVKSED